MNEFRVGDRVKITATPGELIERGISELSARFLPGKIGVVGHGSFGDLISVGVEGDPESGDRQPFPGGWWIRNTHLELVPQTTSQRLTDAIALLKELDAFCQRFVALVPLSGFEVPDCTVHYLHQRLNEIIAQEVLKQ